MTLHLRQNTGKAASKRQEDEGMKAAVISFTKAGYELGRRIRDWLQEQGYEAEAAVKCRDLEESIPESLDQWTRTVCGGRACLYGKAAGIAVRAIALCAGQDPGPAVLVIDEQGASVSLFCRPSWAPMSWPLLWQQPLGWSRW